jgi:catechol 2,3-dioxygenase-like lactoylglutathione lyase family enzyme
MIVGLDHIVALVRDLEQGTTAYRHLLGREPSWRSANDGAATAIFTLDNMSIELMAADGDGATGDAVRAAIETQGEGLASLAFAVDDLPQMHRRLKRLGLAPEDITPGESRDLTSGETISWIRTRSSRDASHGMRLFFLGLNGSRRLSAVNADAPVLALDHVVIATPNPERAAALYGARLGLDMALDRTNEAWCARLMFFRCGDLVIEIVHRLKDGVGDGPDTIWGLSWRVADVEATHRRLTSNGVEVSEVRDGRKPGTRVFSVKGATCGIPTLLIQ